MGSEGFHEPLELLDEASVDHHRAMTSLCEELEAIDWYDQRVKATSDESLAAVLAYNRDDEKEHAAMVLEWLRRRDPALDANLRKFLFTTGPINEVGDGDPGVGAGGATDSDADLSGIARHRKSEGDPTMNHLHRELAPVSAPAWDAIDQEAASRSADVPGCAQAGGLQRSPRVVPFGDQSRTDLLHRRPVGGRGGGPAQGPAPDGAAHGVQRLASPARRCGTRRTRPRPARAGRGGATDRPRRERDGLPWSPARQTARRDREHLARTNPAGRRRGAIARRGGPGRRRRCGRPASTGRTGSPSARTSTRGSSRRPSTGATCSSTIFARSWVGRSCGHPASTAVSYSACAAGTSNSTVDRTCRSGI